MRCELLIRTALFVVVALSAATGCASDDNKDMPGAEPNTMNLEKLKTRIEELGGGDAYPVVPLELFFEGNDDLASIGPNLDPHPGVQTFYRVLRDIRERPEVSDVVLQISEVLQGEGEWPFVEAAYVITTASDGDVHKWASTLQPDPPVEGTTWLYGSPPPGAPPVPDRSRVVTLYWD